MWRDPEGFPRVLTGLIEDRSYSGIGISIQEPIDIGTKVQIRGRLRELSGTVRYCRTRGAKYFVGIELDRKDTSWNRFGAGL